MRGVVYVSHTVRMCAVTGCKMFSEMQPLRSVRVANVLGFSRALARRRVLCVFWYFVRLSWFVRYIVVFYTRRPTTHRTPSGCVLTIRRPEDIPGDLDDMVTNHHETEKTTANPPQSNHRETCVRAKNTAKSTKTGKGKKLKPSFLLFTTCRLANLYENRCHVFVFLVPSRRSLMMNRAGCEAWRRNARRISLLKMSLRGRCLSGTAKDVMMRSKKRSLASRYACSSCPPAT